MNIIVPVPDDFATRFGSTTDLGRRAFEALILEEYRASRMTRAELKRLLGLSDDLDLETLLTAREATAGSIAWPGDLDVEADDIVAQFRAFGADKMLHGLDVTHLIREGRREG